MLQLQNVTKTYKTKAGEVHALNGISLTFPTTGLVFITGKSGCGKTTLLNVIGGLDGIDGGEIFIQDKQFSTFSAAEYDSYRNTFIGFIFQEYNLLPEFTVEKNIKIAMELQGRKAEEIEFEQLLKDVEIDGLKKRKISELSGGQRQRVAIARALVKQPRIIMADEPTGALDSGTGIQVLDTLKKLSEKTLVIVVSHDREFAERYADRIVHLEDGKVAQDVTFTQREITSAVSEQGNKLVVRRGAELSERDKDALAKAIRESKDVEIIENPCFRDKTPTGKVAHNAEDPVSLRKSRMKMKSAAYLGLKSLTVKPLRLVITVLISALAFAVFGICDTIANFSTTKILKNQLKIAPSKTMVSTFDYCVDHDGGDSYSVKVSKKVVDGFQNKTGGMVKGVFDLNPNKTGAVQASWSITELSSSNVFVGKKYYANAVNGLVEFDKETEISQDGAFKDFDYKLVYGKYPDGAYKADGTMNVSALSETAISTYLADSIRHYLNGREWNGYKVTRYQDLVDNETYLTVNQRQYKIVGIIDCGDIPAKYDPLISASQYGTENSTLSSDFNGYIDSTAHKCLFVGKDFLKAMKEVENIADIYYGGNVSWTFSVDGNSGSSIADGYMYSAQNYGADNILLFGGEYPENGEITLADDEVLIHPQNLRTLFASKISALPLTGRTEVYTLIDSLDGGAKEEKRERLAQILDMVKANMANGYLYAKVQQRFVKTNTTKTTGVKIVGVYFGVDTQSYTVANRYRLMINENLMQTFNVYEEQGDYSKALFSARSVRKGGGAVVSQLLNQNGLVLNWYNNAVLDVIRTNETTIRQGADLFLYADLALSVFAIFMLYNYMSTSIASKRQSVGILRALGAGGKNILTTFLIESLIVALINGLLANICAVVGCLLVNMYIVEVMGISVHFALFGIRQILIISGVSLLTALLSSCLPIIRISKKKPVELIRRS